ncbi:MAG TPA: GTP 3',8-cyclase MoaA [Syntrophorhabdaceae bacterium]|nr:GTP 3',8-cyclase MoaA [Syntrophorhabdaceae bacterium]HPU29535.1 GTP 3',8-cyclase MoaA [Syntrophorhabdaceae bacterium]
MLKDNFNRVINYLRISITDRCNLRCRYCVNENLQFKKHDEILTYEEIIRFVKLCANLGIKKVRLTGGEPLVRKNISYLIEEINKIEGIEDIALTTNGVFLGEKVTELKQAGLKRVNISLDSLKKDRYEFITGVDAINDVFTGIKRSIEEGLYPIKINTVIIKGFNDDEIIDFASLAMKWDIHVRFIEFMPFGDPDLWGPSKIVTSKKVEEVIRTVFDLEPTVNQHKGPAKMFKIKGGKGEVGFISPMSTHICSECNRIRLTSDGMIMPCLFSDTEYDVKKLIRENASNEEIMAFIKGVIKEKPQRKYELGQIKKCQRSLRNIGG